MMFHFNNKGFTLIEVLLAVVLLGIALIPIMQIMPSIYNINGNMIRENTLSFLAQDKLEEVKGGAINATNFGSDFGNDSSLLFTGQTEYWYTVNDDLGTDIKIITIQAWYGDAGSTFADAENKIELKTKVAKRDS